MESVAGSALGAGEKALCKAGHLTLAQTGIPVPTPFLLV